MRKPAHVLKLLLAAFILVLPLFWSLPPARADLAPSNVDLWQETNISSYSDSGIYNSGGHYSNVSNMFGGYSGNLEQGNTLFKDGQGAGSLHWVEWTLTAPVTVGSIHLFAEHDGTLGRDAKYRGFSKFTLFAFINGNFKEIYNYSPSNPYNGNVGDPNYNELALVANVPLTAAQIFRAEFVQFGNIAGAQGPRIVELDAFAPIPLPASVWLLGSGLLGLLGLRRKGKK